MEAVGAVTAVVELRDTDRTVSVTIEPEDPADADPAAGRARLDASDELPPKVAVD